MEIDHFESWILIETCCFSTLEDHTIWIVFAYDRILELEVLFLNVTEVLEQDDLLITLNDRVVPLSPSCVAILIAWRKIADDPCRLVAGTLSGRQLCAQVIKKTSWIISLFHQSKVLVMAHICIQEYDIKIIGDRRRVDQLIILITFDGSYDKLIHRVVAILFELVPLC